MGDQEFTPEQIAEFKSYEESQNPKFTEEQIQQFKDYEAAVADQQNAEAGVYHNPLAWGSAGAVGAPIATLGTNALLSGKKEALSEIKDAMFPPDLKAASTKNYTIDPEGYAKSHVMSEHGISPVNAATADYNAAHGDRAAFLRGETPGSVNRAPQGFVEHGNVNMWIPKSEQDRQLAERAAKAAAERAAAEKPIAKMKVALQAFSESPVSKYLGHSLSGFGAAADTADALNRYNKGDYGGAAISGIGSLGSLISMAPNPIAKGVGYGLSMGAPLLNTGLDWALGKDEKKPVHKADGGPVLSYPMGGGLNYTMPGFAEGGSSDDALIKRLQEQYGK